MKPKYICGAMLGTHEKVIYLIDHKKYDNYLDIGCGNGNLAIYLSKNFNIKNIFALDKSQFINFKHPINFKYWDLNILPLPFDDGTFDLITCIEVIEHIENYFALIREIKRILKPNGIAFITTPNINTLISRLNLLFTGKPLFFDEKSYIGSGHINVIYDWALIRTFSEENLYFKRYYNASFIPFTYIDTKINSSLFGNINIWMVKK